MDTAVQAYIHGIADEKRRADVLDLVKLLSGISPEPAKMWGSSIISFGLYHYVYESGRKGDAPKLGISNRKQAIVIYGLHIADSEHANAKLVTKLGTYTTGKGCLYIRKLQDIDRNTLHQMLTNCVGQHD
jgi:hypothetical protein